ncbi:MAG: YbhB/YbcL family Raf kinase inhibitor-like protein [Gammaproteobacteria bacterium]|nr:YbhB/YbcL family Raf kinase inhibitor-like protein [Gammaproteobacteria bacterium]NIR82625.1 YbhB/YbcL family Raf kinase inhibitor-like protein [Gammaproteobacteria bacterium]NIR89088.1 YbhB/YbcL family Raf kinase inhibitor-like protein [Gammaproteobacteria bacterium]NIU03859.1 YbhB/YbcL family Raf kinase inhibitor-like protein [Gammaproteobacteria bacterium]NIV74235.1 YbhB/YbcL family Raf kinase inhibitor-like protein [Gammaproteobacteria bacterium]
MKLTSTSFEHNKPISSEFAFCQPDPDTRVTQGGNKNPALSWSDVPDGTKSLVLICLDPDAPSKADDVNKEGRTIPADLPRVEFYHWILIGLRADAVGIQAGEFSDGVTAGGKDGPEGPRGTRQGINDYTNFLAGDRKMAGTYYGYDGPCPPWNDAIPHRYHFTLYALDIERVAVGADFTGADVLKAIDGHILAQARITATYTTNPDVGD